MPGVNLPWNHILYYLLTLTIAGILHEVGHALAAVRYFNNSPISDLQQVTCIIHLCFCCCCREQVRVNGFGIFFMVIYPGAFVDLYTEHLAVISPLRQLRIYCAGVWHNFILALLAFLFLWLLPSALSFFYFFGRGAVVLDVVKVGCDCSPSCLCNIQHNYLCTGLNSGKESCCGWLHYLSQQLCCEECWWLEVLFKTGHCWTATWLLYRYDDNDKKEYFPW